MGGAIDAARFDVKTSNPRNAIERAVEIGAPSVEAGGSDRFDLLLE
jgi:hypothetical protein